MDSETYDVAVIGSGFGGMGAALELARSGASVVMYEALKYPGGCASTYSRRGHRFELAAHPGRVGEPLLLGHADHSLQGRKHEERLVELRTRLLPGDGHFRADALRAAFRGAAEGGASRQAMAAMAAAIARVSAQPAADHGTDNDHGRQELDMRLQAMAPAARAQWPRRRHCGVPPLALSDGRGPHTRR